MNVYKITHLENLHKPVYKIANTMPSGWGKFVAQHFGPLAPNSSDYDIRLEHHNHAQWIELTNLRAELRAQK